MYGKGISREGSLIDMSVDLGIVKKSGAWFTYEGEQLGQGRENAKTFLAENPEIMVEISDRVLVAAGLKPGDRATPPARQRPSATADGNAHRRSGDRRSPAVGLVEPTRPPSSSTDQVSGSQAGLEDHQVEHHDQQQVGDADAGGQPAPGRRRSVSVRPGGSGTS